MSFATISDMASRSKNATFREDVRQVDGPTNYAFDRSESLAPRWYEWRHWSKKKWIVAGVTGGLLLVIIIVVAVVATKKDGSYPAYAALSYSLAETCKLCLLIRRDWLITDWNQILAWTFFKILIILQVMSTFHQRYFIN